MAGMTIGPNGEVNIEWHGDEVMKKVKDAKIPALTKACKIVQSSAKADVPVLSGELQGSIVIKVEGEEGKVGTNVDYARRIEYGFQDTDKLGREYNQTAQPYLRPALDNNRKAIEDLIGKFIGKAAEDGGRK